MYLIQIDAGNLLPPTAIEIPALLRCTFLRKLPDDTVTPDSLWPSSRSCRSACLNHVSYPPVPFPSGLRVTWSGWHFPLETALGLDVPNTSDYFRETDEFPTSAELVSTDPASSFLAESGRDSVRKPSPDPDEWLADSYGGRIEFRFTASDFSQWTVRSLSDLELGQATLPIGAVQPPRFALIASPRVGEVDVFSPRILLLDEIFCNERGAGFWRESTPGQPIANTPWTDATRFGGIIDSVQDFGGPDVRTHNGGYRIEWKTTSTVNWVGEQTIYMNRRHCWASDPEIFAPGTTTRYTFLVSGLYMFETARAPGSTGGPIGLWPRSLFARISSSTNPLIWELKLNLWEVITSDPEWLHVYSYQHAPGVSGLFTSDATGNGFPIIEYRAEFKATQLPTFVRLEVRIGVKNELGFDVWTPWSIITTPNGMQDYYQFTFFNLYRQGRFVTVPDPVPLVVFSGNNIQALDVFTQTMPMDVQLTEISVV